MLIVIRFVVRETVVTWFINDNWVFVFTFLLTAGSGIIFRKIKSSQKINSKKIKISNPKGGAFIDQCIEPDGVYEIVDPTLEIVVRQMLNLEPGGLPVIISTPVLILAYIVSKQTVKQLTITGVDIFIQQTKSVGIKGVVGVLTGSIFYIAPASIIGLTSGVFAGAIFIQAILSLGNLNFNCNDYVLPLPMNEINPGQTIGFLEKPAEKSPKVYVKGSDNTQVYAPKHNFKDRCSAEYDGEKPYFRRIQSQVRRKCEKSEKAYGPLESRTSTLKDIKKGDSSESREKAQPFIDRYESRLRRYERRREQIMKERQKNDEF